MTTGTIKEYDQEKGYGSIEPDSDRDRESIPFEVEKEQRGSLKVGDRVAYDVYGGMTGLMAVDVRKV